MGYATIRGRFLNPAAPVGGNARPLRGKIIFRPTSLVVSGSATSLPVDVTAELDSSGYLSYEGERDIRLLAPEAGQDAPAWWSWEAHARLYTDGGVIPRDPVVFTVQAGDVLDIAEIFAAPYRRGNVRNVEQGGGGSPRDYRVVDNGDGTARIEEV